MDGARVFEVVRKQDNENKREFYDYLTRRTARDPDIWLVEVDIADAERFVAEFAH